MGVSSTTGSKSLKCQTRISLSGFTSLHCPTDDGDDGWCCNGYHYDNVCDAMICGCYGADDFYLTAQHPDGPTFSELSAEEQASYTCRPGECPTPGINQFCWDHGYTRSGPTADDTQCAIQLGTAYSKLGTENVDCSLGGYCCDGVYYEDSCKLQYCGCFDVDDHLCNPGQCPPSGHIGM